MADAVIVEITQEVVEVPANPPTDVVNVVTPGLQGPIGPGNLYIQSTAPTNPPAKYAWFEIISSSAMTLWVQDGA